MKPPTDINEERTCSSGAGFCALADGQGPIIAIAFIGMKPISLDSYVIDVLMPDLVGHDKAPAAFLVYLFLLRTAQQKQKDAFEVSLQTIAVKTGLAKSTVQMALRRLKRRGLLDPQATATTSHPLRSLRRPWSEPPRS